MAKNRKKWTTQELDRIGKEIERGNSPTRLLDESEAAELERARRGRPRRGRGSKAIQTTIEIGLLERVDALAEALDIPRAKLIAEGLERILEESDQAKGPLAVYAAFSTYESCIETAENLEEPERIAT